MAETLNNENGNSEAIQPYNMHVSSKYLELTRRKLELTRLPRELELDEKRMWQFGTPKKLLEPLIDYWLEQYDWRAQETILNTVLPQFRTSITLPENGPLKVHYVHKRSTNSKAIPLLFCHGWPGSFLEVSKAISVLSESPAMDSGVAPGVDDSDIDANRGQVAFHVVAPSIPGFGFSDASRNEAFGLKETADVFDSLMKQLGYNEYVAHGADWGFQICRSLALRHPGNCVAIHTTNPKLPAPMITRSPLTFFKYHIARITGARFRIVDFGYVPSDFTAAQPIPQRYEGDVSMTEKTESFAFNRNAAEVSGIEKQYSTHPQTTSYSLCDSPAGLLALLLDILGLPSSAHNTTTSAASPWTPTDLLNWTMMQWLPGPEAGLRWLSQARKERDLQWSTYSEVPLGISCFRGNGTGISRGQSVEPDVELGEETAVSSSPPLWAQAVQRLCWVKRHGRSSARAGWEEAGEMSIDLREWASQLIEEGWIKV